MPASHAEGDGLSTAVSTDQPIDIEDRTRDGAHERPVAPSYHRWCVKRWFERVVAFACLIIVSPILFLLAAVVKFTSEGPTVFVQKRLGLGGKSFQMCKLRTMTDNAEEFTGPVWAMRSDPRVTWVGHYLRKFHLDELPQLWNIARGEMSFVGPRPERPEISEELKEEIAGYQQRLAVLPGVTGLAQVNLAPDETVDCVRRKLELDIEYIFTAEPLLDLRIVGCTTLKMIGVPRTAASRLLCVNRLTGLGAVGQMPAPRRDICVMDETEKAEIAKPCSGSEVASLSNLRPK